MVKYSLLMIQSLSFPNRKVEMVQTSDKFKGKSIKRNFLHYDLLKVERTNSIKFLQLVETLRVN